MDEQNVQDFEMSSALETPADDTVSETPVEAAPEIGHEKPGIFYGESAAKEQPNPYPVFTYEPPKKHTGRKILKLFGFLALVALIIVFCISCTNIIWGAKYNGMMDAYNNKVAILEEKLENANTGTPSTIIPTPDLDGEGMVPAQVYESCVNTVVAIESTVRSQGYFGQTSESYSTGSGVILSSDGYIVTNFHVVQGGTRISVVTYDNVSHDAELVGYDQANDIAVLKIEGENLPAASVGSSDTLLVGDKVAAIGNPLGELTATMTVGYISAKDRLVNTDGTAINMLQTDAAINSGNSGGPLFNMYGQVVGITTAKYSGTSNSGASIEGIGFAIPINDVVDIIDDLMNYGYVTGAYLGVYVRDMDKDVANTYNLPLGAYVDEVTKGYAAEAAGLKRGDIIVDLGGYKITCMADLTRALRKFNAGDKTTITVFRSGAEQHLPIILSDKPQEQDLQPETTEPKNNYNDWYSNFFG